MICYYNNPSGISAVHGFHSNTFTNLCRSAAQKLPDLLQARYISWSDLDQSALSGDLIYELTSASLISGMSGHRRVPTLLYHNRRRPHCRSHLAPDNACDHPGLHDGLAFILGILTFTKLVAPWHILVLAFLLGVANAFDAPARQSFVVELVEREDLTNAISLNAAMFNMANILGPAFGGLIYAWVGPVWCFTINGFSFIDVIGALLLIQLPQFIAPPRQNAMTELKEGFRFVRDHAPIKLLIVTVGMVSMFAFSLLTLIPAWATEILGGDVRTNGLLLAARGAGALAGALTLATLSGNGFGKILECGDSCHSNRNDCFFDYSQFNPGVGGAGSDRLEYDRTGE